MTAPSTTHEALRKLYKYALLACNDDKPQDIIEAYKEVLTTLPEEETLLTINKDAFLFNHTHKE